MGGGDHPRLRGEQTLTVKNVPAAEGSPPLARGTERHSSYMWSSCGITPACAGNRWDGINATTVYRDHPRLRGEQLVTVTV